MATLFFLTAIGLVIDVNQRTAVYRTVCTVVWKVGAGNNPVPPIRFEHEKALLNKFYSTANDIGLPVPNMERFKSKLGMEEMKISKSNKWINQDYIELAVHAQHYEMYQQIKSMALYLLGTELGE